MSGATASPQAVSKGAVSTTTSLVVMSLGTGQRAARSGAALERRRRGGVVFDGKVLGSVSRLFVDSVLGWYRRASTRERTDHLEVLAWQGAPKVELSCAPSGERSITEE